MQVSHDRAFGALLGTALGDAFGAPLEGIGPGASEKELLTRASRRRPWRYTDDTQMALAVGRALAHGRELEPEVLLAELAGSFDPARGYGRGTRRCLEAFLRGTPWEACAFTSWPEGSAGNGAAARVAAVACRFWNDSESLVRVAALSSRVTHAHPDAIYGAVLQAVSVAVCLRSDLSSFSGAEFLRNVEAYDVGDWSSMKLARIGRLLQEDASPTVVAAALGTGTLAAEAVPAGLWAFARAGKSFESSVLLAARLGGDVDTICALTGALAGALGGRNALPAQWVANLQHEIPGVDEIESIARALSGTRPNRAIPWVLPFPTTYSAHGTLRSSRA